MEANRTLFIRYYCLSREKWWCENPGYATQPAHFSAVSSVFLALRSDKMRSIHPLLLLPWGERVFLSIQPKMLAFSERFSSLSQRAFSYCAFPRKFPVFRTTRPNLYLAVFRAMSTCLSLFLFVLIPSINANIPQLRLARIVSHRLLTWLDYFNVSSFAFPLLLPVYACHQDYIVGFFTPTSHSMFGQV